MKNTIENFKRIDDVIDDYKGVSGIYGIEVNSECRICYVGRGVSIKSRWRDHIRYSDPNKPLVGKRSRIHAAMRKYGMESCRLYLIELCPTDDLDEREIYWIKELDTKEKGRNLTNGGDGFVGGKHTNETKEKMRECSTGRQHTKESKELMRQIRKKQAAENPMSKEQKNKISESKNGQIYTIKPCPYLGCTYTNRYQAYIDDHIAEEHPKYYQECFGMKQWKIRIAKVKKKRKRRSQSHKGNKQTEETKEKISKTVSRNLKGHKVTEETRKKIGESNKRKIFTTKHCPYLGCAHTNKYQKSLDKHMKACEHN